jgi:hypothetical protein
VHLDGIHALGNCNPVRASYEFAAINHIRDFVNGKDKVCLPIPHHRRNRIRPRIRRPDVVAVVKVEESKRWKVDQSVRDFLAECRHQTKLWPPFL